MSNPMFVQVSDFCDTGSGTTPSRKKMDEYYGGSIPWVKSGELREGIIHLTEETVTERALKETALKIAPSGALLVAMYGATVGRVGRLGVAATTNQAICHVVPDPKLADEQYMFHALCAKSEELIGRGVGGAQPNISQGTIKETKIYLPPLPEQRRIAGILDQADALRRLRRQSLSRLSDLGQAIFHEMFGDVATNPKGWPVGTIRDLLSEAKYGTAQKANSDGKGLPILRMGNLTYSGQLDLSDLKHVELTAKDFPKYTTQRGDLLFNRTNSKELVGKTAVVDLDDPLAIAGYLIRARTNKRGNPHYISAYLNSKHGKAVLRNMCKNIVGMANINAQELQDIVIALPPVELQNEFADRLAMIAKHREAFNSGTEQSDFLFAALQHRAFRGEL